MYFRRIIQYIGGKKGLWISLMSLIGLCLAWVLILTLHKEGAEKSADTGFSGYYSTADSLRADSLLALMSPEQKAAQLFMTHADPALFCSEDSAVLNLVKKLSPGGYCFSHGRVSMLRQACMKIDSLSALPVFMAAPASFGLFDPSDSLGRHLFSYSSILQDSVFTENLLMNTAAQMKYYGINMNFGPSLHELNLLYDIPSDQGWTGIVYAFTRSFSRYISGMQRQGIISCGTGITAEKRSGFKALPAPALLQNYSDPGLPLRQMCDEGLQAVCIRIPASLTKEKITADSVRRHYPLRGIVIADVRELPQQNAGEFCLYLLQNGADMVLAKSEVLPLLLSSIANGGLPADVLNRKVKHILLTKSKLWHKDAQALPDSLKTLAGQGMQDAFYRKLAEKSITVLNNRKNLLPFGDISKYRFACVEVAKNPATSGFMAGLSQYASFTWFSQNTFGNKVENDALTEKLRNFNAVIFVFGDTLNHMQDAADYIGSLSKNKACATFIAGGAEKISQLPAFPCLIWSPAASYTSAYVAAQSVMGARPFGARLPFSLSNFYCFNEGSLSEGSQRLTYGIPEEGGALREKLLRVDSIVNAAMNAGAFPACQVFAARNGHVILNRAWGFHTYERKTKTGTDDLFDLASVTKAAATTLVIMALTEQGKIHPDSLLSKYFNDLDKNRSGKKVRTSRLNFITVRELLTHCSGLSAGLPINRFISPKKALEAMMRMQKDAEPTDSMDYPEEEIWPAGIDTSLSTEGSDTLLRWIYSKNKTADHTIEVAASFWMRAVCADSLWQLAKQSATRKSKKYLYSDLNMYILMKLAERVSGKSLDKFFHDYYVSRLKLGRMAFNPYKSYKPESIVPTEDEKFFRKQLIHGYVHDPTAALAGGVGGNAGLFSSAHDLGILMQMLLNGGRYGGIQFLNSKTVAMFTSPQKNIWRGMGFDRKSGQGSKMVCSAASLKTYGHTGFTGTCVWVDPEKNLVYVFLSNRVHPRSSNQKINSLRVRQQVQQAIYEALL